MKREKPRTRTKDNVIYMESSKETKEANDRREQLTRSQRKLAMSFLRWLP
ncbi:MAG: hypothetical protein IKJ73_12330 [Lachnospiraceae bacterium]|nr:hypothetical protein [Lachnospiraceae bacterium]